MSDGTHLMVDLETLGRDADAPILQIGLVQFDSDDLHEEAGMGVSLASNEEIGQWGVEADTLSWWLGQDNADDVLTGGVGIEDALRTVSELANSADTVWACSPTFDTTILRHAYEQVGWRVPWQFYDLRDVRTVREESPHWPEREQEGTEHDALDDARYQARCVSEYLGAIEDEGDQDDE